MVYANNMLHGCWVMGVGSTCYFDFCIYLLASAHAIATKTRVRPVCRRACHSVLDSERAGESYILGESHGRAPGYCSRKYMYST